MAQRFTEKKGLTKKLNMKGWSIYRDSKYGLYTENKELGIDHGLLIWNLTLDDPKLEKALGIIRSELQDLEREEREKEPLDPNKRIVVEASWLDRV